MTKHYFYFDDPDVDYELISPDDLSEIERMTLKRHVMILSHIREIDDLFQVFRFNLASIDHNFSISIDDVLTRQGNDNFGIHDYHAINALITGYISAGHSLIESIEIFFKTNNPDALPEFKKGYISKEYDDNFSYRLLLRLRDLSQQGHLPVWKSHDGRYCFDINHILFVSHFTHNAAIKKQLEEIRLEFFESQGDYPRIGLLYSINEFNTCVTRIFVAFLKNIRNLLHDSVDAVDAIIMIRDDIIKKPPDQLKGSITFEVDEYNVNHRYYYASNENMKKSLSDLTNEIAQILKEEEVYLKKIKEKTMFWSNE